MTLRAKPLRGLLAAPMLALLHGCATPDRGTGQAVRIETPGCARAACELSNDRGRWSLPDTPGSVDVVTSAHPLRVACRSPQGHTGQGDAAATAPSGTRGAVTGGIVGGGATGAMLGGTALTFIPVLGVLALATGAAVGAAAGQAADATLQGYTYPAVIRIEMRCNADAEAPARAAARAPPGLDVRLTNPTPLPPDCSPTTGCWKPRGGS